MEAASICSSISTSSINGILDIASGVITYANAGHEPPAIRTGNGKFAISKEKHGALLGAFGKED